MEFRNSFERIMVKNEAFAFPTLPNEALACRILPNEIIEKICIILDNVDLQNSSLVSRTWNKSSIKVILQEKIEINNVAQFLVDNLDTKYEKEKSDILNIINDKRIFDCINLMEVINSYRKSKETILNNLKNLDDQKLSNLEKMYNEIFKPDLLKDIFIFAPIYKRLDHAYKITDYNEKGAEFHNIIRLLLDNNHIDKSINIANEFTLESCLYIGRESGALCQISMLLTLDKKFDKAIKVAKLISDIVYQKQAFSNICKILVANKLFEQAIEVAKMMPNKNQVSEELKKISKELMILKQFKEAIDVAMMIPKKFIKENTFSEICSNLWADELYDQALDVTENLTEHNLNYALSEIAIGLAKSGDPAKAMGIVIKLENDYLEGPVQEIAISFVKMGQMDKAKEAINLISNKKSRGNLLKKVKKITPDTAKIVFEKKNILNFGNCNLN